MKYFLQIIVAIGAVITSNLLIAHDDPIYSDSNLELTIPSVDTEDHPGFYKDVRLEFYQNDLWRLTRVTTTTVLQEIYDVELVKTDNIPIQVFLKISGALIDGCRKLGEIDVRRKEHVFEIYIHIDPHSIPADDVACPGSVTFFTKTVPLPVYGLNAGDGVFVQRLR